ncbi:2-acylglycerol O-acyltransferase 2 isoform X2 [Halyomorpha halys]|nr:2-acylglycerol O-acyltransferase 2 isoform X2 [Halyomorpha halys]XP_014294119.1 2-acylglycerol O-acyltransferase 2 isoform X2 [Halyomorpha halys]
MPKKLTFFEKCLQTLAVIQLAMTISCQITIIPIMLYITFFTKYWLFTILTLVWTWYDKEKGWKGGRSSRFMRELPHFKYLRDYFPIDLVKTADLDPNKNYLFCNHPHGLLSTASFINFCLGTSPRTELFPGLRFFMTSLDVNLKYPVVRDYGMCLGLISASKKSLTYLLNDSKKGNVVILMIGGAEEVIYTIPGKNKLILKKRKGFIKLALKLGCGLVPVFHFGENDLFQLKEPNPGTWLYTAQQWIKKKTGAVLALPMGQFGLFCVPKGVPLTTVVGKPINVPKVAEPTQEQIDHYHAVYTEALVNLFEEHKYKYMKDPENSHLEIIE